MSPTRSLVVIGIAAALAVTGCASSANTTSSNKKQQNVGAATGDKVSIMVGGLNKQIYLPFMLAERLGYYKDEGLNITLSDEPAGVGDAELAPLPVGGRLDLSLEVVSAQLDLPRCHQHRDD